MYNEVLDFLKSFTTQQEIPLHNILTPADLHNIAATISVITKSKSVIAFENTAEDIFRPLEDKGLNIVENQILYNAFSMGEVEVPEINMLKMLYYCFMYLYIKHELPVEQSLLVISNYMQEMVIKESDIKQAYNPKEENVNIIPLLPGSYIKTTFKNIIPPFSDSQENFIQKIKSLLIP